MKKLLIIFPILFFMIGCSIANTPTSKVEALMMKYQKLDEEIIKGIDEVINSQNLTEEHADRYRKLLEKQYKNLSYEIKNELIDGDTATVLTSIEVIDYKKAIADLTFDSSVYTKETYDEEKLNRLEETSDKVSYTLEFTLKKDDNGKWVLNALSNEQIKKIQGMY